MRQRLEQLLDEDTWEELSGEIEPLDVLGFADSKPYAERFADAQRKTGFREGALYGTGTIGGQPVVLAAMNFAFIGGSMGSGVGEAVTRAAELALETRSPLVLVATSGGARMQEGCISLMQMAKTSQAIGRLHEEGILYIVVLTDPTYGGVSASFATLGDVLIAEPGSYIGFAGPKVIEQTIRQTLPDGFQTSEFLLDHGQLDLVEPRENLRGVAAEAARPARARRRRAHRGRPAAAERARRAGTAADHRSGRAPGASGRGTSSSSRATSTGRTRSSTSRPSSTSSRSCTATGCTTRTRRSSAPSRGSARSRSW